MSNEMNIDTNYLLVAAEVLDISPHKPLAAGLQLRHPLDESCPKLLTVSRP